MQVWLVYLMTQSGQLIFSTLFSGCTRYIEYIDHFLSFILQLTGHCTSCSDDHTLSALSHTTYPHSLNMHCCCAVHGEQLHNFRWAGTPLAGLKPYWNRTTTSGITNPLIGYEGWLQQSDWLCRLHHQQSNWSGCRYVYVLFVCVCVFTLLILHWWELQATYSHPYGTACTLPGNITLPSALFCFSVYMANRKLAVLQDVLHLMFKLSFIRYLLLRFIKYIFRLNPCAKLNSESAINFQVVYLQLEKSTVQLCRFFNPNTPAGVSVPPWL